MDYVVTLRAGQKVIVPWHERESECVHCDPYRFRHVGPAGALYEVCEAHIHAPAMRRPPDLPPAWAPSWRRGVWA